MAATSEPAARAPSENALEGGSVRELAGRVNKKRLALVVGTAVVVLGAAIGLIVFLVNREPGPSLEDLAFSAMTDAVVAAEATADAKNRTRLDLAALRADLDANVSGYTVDVASSEDGAQVGIAAKDIDGPGCLLVWSATGLPQQAAVDDPNLLCAGRLALANLR